MNTTYFDEMTGNCAVWERAKKERAERKQQISDTFGYDSPEMDAWYAEDKAAGSYPYTSGEMKAYWGFKNRRENDGGEFKGSVHSAHMILLGRSILRLPPPLTPPRGEGNF